MTKKEKAKLIVEQNGDCNDPVTIGCDSRKINQCPIFEECDNTSDSDRCKLAKAWLDNNRDIPEINSKIVRCRVSDNCDGYNNEIGIVGKVNTRYLDITGNFWNHAEPLKETAFRQMNLFELLLWQSNNPSVLVRYEEATPILCGSKTFSSCKHLEKYSYAENTGHKPKEEDWKKLPLIEEEV